MVFGSLVASHSRHTGVSLRAVFTLIGDAVSQALSCFETYVSVCVLPLSLCGGGVVRGGFLAVDLRLCSIRQRDETSVRPNPDRAWRQDRIELYEWLSVPSIAIFFFKAAAFVICFCMSRLFSLRDTACIPPNTEQLGHCTSMVRS